MESPPPPNPLSSLRLGPPPVPSPPPQRVLVWYAADPPTGVMLLAQMGYGPTDQRQMTPELMARATVLIRRAAAVAGLDDATMARTQTTLFAAPDGRLAGVMLSRPVTCLAEVGVACGATGLHLVRGVGGVLAP